MINQETEEEQENEEEKKSPLFSQGYQVGNTSSTCPHCGARRDEETGACVDFALQPCARLKAGQCLLKLWRKEVACILPLAPPLISG